MDFFCEEARRALTPIIYTVIDLSSQIDVQKLPEYFTVLVLIHSDPYLRF